MAAAFGDALADAARERGPLCVGIDPHPGRVPALFGGDTAEGLARWGSAVAELAAGRAAAVKPQAGLFERLGPPGMEALAEVCRSARARGLLVIMDAKRGDIGSTARGYADAYLGRDQAFACDALTVNPYMGLDTLEPFAAAAEATGRGVFVLVRTSNPGAADFQALECDGAPLWMRVAEALAPLAERLKGSGARWSSLGLVCGATAPEEARRLREAAPHSPFLVPGYGAQGAGAAEALAGFVAGERGGLEGGTVNASRSVTFPEAAEKAASESEWADAVTAAMDAAASDLKAASAPA